LEQQDHHVGRLGLDLGARARVVEDLQRVLVAYPSNVVHELPRLDGDRHRQVLRIVELVPVTLGGKARDRVLQAGNVGLRGDFRLTHATDDNGRGAETAPPIPCAA
ncbi:MAG: hypothetical protein ACK55I_41320, partial [bacterium]